MIMHDKTKKDVSMKALALRRSLPKQKSIKKLKISIVRMNFSKLKRRDTYCNMFSCKLPTLAFRKRQYQVRVPKDVAPISQKKSREKKSKILFFPKHWNLKHKPQSFYSINKCLL